MEGSIVCSSILFTFAGGVHDEIQEHFSNLTFSDATQPYPAILHLYQSSGWQIVSGNGVKNFKEFLTQNFTFQVCTQQSIQSPYVYC